MKTKKLCKWWDMKMRYDPEFEDGFIISLVIRLNTTGEGKNEEQWRENKEEKGDNNDTHLRGWNNGKYHFISLLVNGKKAQA